MTVAGNIAPSGEATGTTARGRAASSGPFRPDIQALRAIAILAVVLNHLWPVRFTGGFVGVDVFFVISGFLITGHLVREAGTSGTIRLREFYARRIRRLLPAALTVLVVTLVGVWALLPSTRWDVNGTQIAASAFYVENWTLALSSVDYFAHDAAPSAVQHFWSLSVEEQFYLVWPLLLLAALWVRPGRGLGVRARALLMLVVVAAASFAFSVTFTAASPAEAYFATTTRAWEFAVGGLVAVLVAGRELPRLIRGLAVVAGLAAIAWAIFRFDGDVPFPGWAALLPVLGTAAVIVGGTGASALPVWRLIAGNRVVGWVGDVSYSWYLWHWPAIVLLPFAFDQTLTTEFKVAIFFGTLALAWLTRRFVEVPMMRLPALVGSWWRTIVAMIVVVALVGGAGLALASAGRSADAAESPTAVLPTGDCTGPAALANLAACGTVSGPVTDPEATARTEYFYTPEECGDFIPMLAYGDKRTTRECRFSEEPPTKRVWLVGDSHAQQWQGALFDLAEAENWELTISFMGGCPTADVAFIGFRDPWGEADQDVCRQYSRDLSEQIVAEAPDLVFTTMAARQQIVDDGSGLSPDDQFVAGLLADWDRWTAAGSTVIPIADTPYNGQVRPADCLLLSADDPGSCARPRVDAAPFDAVAAAGAQAPEGVHLLDFTDRFCDEAQCFAAVGGIGVYYDADHLSLEYVRMLVPEFRSRLGSLISPS